MIKRVLPFVLSSLGACAFGCLFIFIFVNATEVTCVRQPDASYTCQIRRLLFGQVQVSTNEVAGVVDIVMVSDSCDEGCAYRAEFVTSDGRQSPLSIVYTNSSVVQPQVSGIKTQIASQAATFDYRAEPPVWVLLLIVGLTVLIVGLSSLTMLRRV
jgi:hypothetical protein